MVPRPRRTGGKIVEKPKQGKTLGKLKASEEGYRTLVGQTVEEVTSRKRSQSRGRILRKREEKRSSDRRSGDGERFNET